MLSDSLKLPCLTCAYADICHGPDGTIYIQRCRLDTDAVFRWMVGGYAGPCPGYRSWAAHIGDQAERIISAAVADNSGVSDAAGG